MEKIKSDVMIFNLIAYIFIGTIAICCLFPFLILVIGSFTAEEHIIRYGFTLFPGQLSLEAYDAIFRNPWKILRSYSVTVFITVAGTGTSLFMSTMAAYVMYRKDFKYRNYIAFYLYFTTLFSGGLVPYYILVVRYLHMKNTITILLLSGMFSVFNILILRNFISGSIPDSLVESAKIDGAGDFLIFVRIVFPLMKPALASIGLFTALVYWNDWWTSMLFIQKDYLYPLQYSLYLMISSVNFATSMVMKLTMPTIDMPKESLKLAMTVVATGPIVFLYPLVQKHFIKGITIGAVKG